MTSTDAALAHAATAIRIRLTQPQQRALRMINSGGYGIFTVDRFGTQGVRHVEHRPGNAIIDMRTLRVLREAGLVDTSGYTIRLTEAGRAELAALRAAARD